MERLPSSEAARKALGRARRRASVVQSHVRVEETSVRRTDLQMGVEYRVLVQALSGDGNGDSVTRTVATNGVGAGPLKARFVSPPARHDGG